MKENLLEGIKKQAMSCPFSDDYKRGIIFGGVTVLKRAGIIENYEDLFYGMDIATELGLLKEGGDE